METTRSAHLPRPAFATVCEYGARLGDAGFWAPYVAAVLRRHRLPAAAPQAGLVGTFPTFLAGRRVVKLFGELFAGAVAYEVERSVHRLLLPHPEVPAPALVAEGQLFSDLGEGWPWPYVVTARLAGTPWSAAALQAAEQEGLARDLGAVVRRVHALPPPGGAVWARDKLAELRAGCVARHRRWGTLPAHLVDQIDRFLVVPSPARRLLHADLHGDHLFVDHGRLVDIIDWGDALVADPFYELPALHLHTFGGNTRLLGAFLAGYGWEVGSDFARRAMTMTLVHEFNVLSGVAANVDLTRSATLDGLADLLWEPP